MVDFHHPNPQSQSDPKGTQYTGENTAAAAASQTDSKQDLNWFLAELAMDDLREATSNPHDLTVRGHTAENCFVRSQLGISHEQQTPDFFKLGMGQHTLSSTQTKHKGSLLVASVQQLDVLSGSKQAINTPQQPNTEQRAAAGRCKEHSTVL